MNDSFQKRTVTNVFDQLSIAIEIVDLEGVTRYLNMAFTKLTGHGATEVLDGDATAALREDGASFASLHGRGTTPITRIEDCRKADGSAWMCETTVQPIRRVGMVETDFFVVVRREVKAQALPIAIKELDQDQIDEIGHDLRTPLNAIIGYTEMLLEDAATEGRAEVADDLERIRKASRQLQRAIGDTLKEVALRLQKART